MRLSTVYRGGNDPFEGDRTLWLQALPANAQVVSAAVTVSPMAPGGVPFVEQITFTNGQGDLGATTVSTAGFVEVDFHARRTLTAVHGDVSNAALQIDLGGVYVELNERGAIKTPDEDPLLLNADGVVPGLTVNRFKLSRATAPRVDRVLIRSAPANVHLRLGQLAPFWTYPGEMTQPQTSGDFAQVLRLFLAGARIEHGIYAIPLTVHSDALARLDVQIEIEYQYRAELLPDGLAEANLSFDYNTLPKTEGNLLQVVLPPGAQVIPQATTATVLGGFEPSRIVYGPAGSAVPPDWVPVTPALAQAQPIRVDSNTPTTALDLLLAAATRKVALSINLLDDADGKPWNEPLLPVPLTVDLDRDVAGAPTWISVPLPAEFQFAAGRRYWLVLQALQGDAVWSVEILAPGVPGLQSTTNGGLAWRAAALNGAPVAGLFRLRYLPGRFQVPIELLVGTGERASRVSLDRFQPLGRVDFALDFAEVAAAFNDYLAAGPPQCPAGEHLANPNFDEWLRVGQDLMPVQSINLPAGEHPAALAATPNGDWIYVASATDEGSISTTTHAEEAGHLYRIEPLCNTIEPVADLPQLTPSGLQISPDGTRIYLITCTQRLHIIDAQTHRQLGQSIYLRGGVQALTLSRDGRRLIMTQFFFEGESDAYQGYVRSFDTAILEEVAAGRQELSAAVLAERLLGNNEPSALALSPDGSQLYVAVPRSETQGIVHLLAANTLFQSSPPIEVGEEPRALAVLPEGRRLLVANATDNDVSVIDLERRQVSATIAVGERPVALAVEPDGQRAWVANSTSNDLSVVDLVRLQVTQTVPVGTAPGRIALTPQGDRIYIANTGGQTVSVIPIGTQIPGEWAITSGWVALYCQPDPFRAVALLGPDRRLKAPPRLPSALSQVVPVVGDCPYTCSFWGVTNQPGAVAEVIWRSATCGLLRTDSIPIATIEPTQAQRIQRGEFSGAGRAGVALVRHALSMQSPTEATQAEIRFTVPPDGHAAIDRVSFQASAQLVANQDFQMQAEEQAGGLPLNWTLSPAGALGVLVSMDEAGVRLKNMGTEPVALLQTTAVTANQTLTLTFEGKVTALPTARGPARVEIHWIAEAGAAAGNPAVLTLSPATFEHAEATASAPAAAVQAEIRLVIPEGVTLQARRIALHAVDAVAVPITFVAQAPGALTVSAAQVVYDVGEAPQPALPPAGLCAPTPPRRAGDPATGAAGCCYCPCCQTEHAAVRGMQTALTRAGHPVQTGRCPTCGAPLLTYGGSAPAAARRLSAAEFPTRRHIAPTVAAARPAVILDAFTRPIYPATPLTTISGIGAVRARQLGDIGIESVEALANATPQDVAGALTGVSIKMARDYIAQARRAERS